MYANSTVSKARPTPALRQAVSKALRTGALVKGQVCEQCGANGKLHGHHDDYAQPLAVRWLCPKCHGLAHRKPRPAKTMRVFIVNAAGLYKFRDQWTDQRDMADLFTLEQAVDLGAMLSEEVSVPDFLRWATRKAAAAKWPKKPKEAKV